MGTQNTRTGGGTETQTQDEPQTQRLRGFGPGHGFRDVGFGGPSFRGLPFGHHLALGTTVEVSLYDGDPAAGGNSLETLTFIYGEDSEAGFAQRLAEAQEDAAYLVVNVGEQTQTLELASVRHAHPLLTSRPTSPLRGMVQGVG